MENYKCDYIIEFTLPNSEAKLKVVIQGVDHEDALNELFKVIRKKTVIHRLEKPDTPRNQMIEVANGVVDLLKGKKFPL